MENNIQPTGRSESSYGAKFYFNSKFTRIDPPKPGEINFTEKSGSSVCSEFNCAQSEHGRNGIAGSTCRQWIKKYYGTSLALCPHMTDYCDTYKHMKEEIQRCTVSIQRIRDGGNAVESRLKALEDHKSTLSKQLADHKEDASKAREFFHKMTAKCRDDWHTITELQAKEALTESEHRTLDKLI